MRCELTRRGFARRGLFLLTLTFCTLRAGFTLPFGQQSRKPPDANEPPLPGVVQLLAVGPGDKDTNRECAATGFFVNAEGYIVTNAHVVENLQRCLRKDSESGIVAKPPSADRHFARAFPAEIIALDEAHDLAVLKIRRPRVAEDDPPSAFVLLDPGELQAGSHVAVSGHPAFSWEPVTQYGQVVRGLKMNIAEKEVELTDVWLLDIPLRHGNSGSPVYSVEGRTVIGVVVSKNPSNFKESVAVQVKYVVHLLNAHGIGWQAPPR